MVTFTKESGTMIRHMEEVYIFTWMELSIMETGEKISNMVMDRKHGQMVPNTMVTTSTVKSMEPGHLNGLITANTLENFTTIIFKAKVSILGVTVGNTKVSGRITKCMEKAPLHGVMAGNMLENMWKIKSKDMENLFGQMEDHIKETGLMESSMVKEYM